MVEKNIARAVLAISLILVVKCLLLVVGIDQSDVGNVLTA